MGDLTDTNRVNLKTTEAKVKDIVRDHFMSREEGRRIGEESEKRDAARGHTEEMEKSVYKALSGTSNTSAPGLDSIGYKLIKATMKTKFGKALIKEIADH